MSRASRGVVVSLLVAGLLTGCTKTRESKVSRMDMPLLERTQTVRHSGEYVARWTSSNQDHLKTIPGSSVIAVKGERLGFVRTEDGQLLAIHNDNRFALQTPPPKAKYVVWYNQTTVQTQFGKNMEKAGDGTVEVLKVVGVGALIVGALWLAAQDDDKCDDDPSFLEILFNNDD